MAMSVCALLELRRKLNVATTVIQISNLEETLNLSLNYEPHSITATVSNKSQTYVEEFTFVVKSSDGVCFVPNKFSGLSQSCLNSGHRRELDVSVRAEIKSSTAEKPNKLLKFHYTFDRMRENVLYCLFCKRCGNRITQEFKFRRILPMPSNDWKELASDWYCHKHSSDLNGLPTNGCILPKYDECFLTVNNLIIDPKIANIEEHDSLLTCDRCCSTLGCFETVSKQHVLKLFKFYVTIKSIEDSLKLNNSICYAESPEIIIINHVNMNHAVKKFIFESQNANNNEMFDKKTSSDKNSSSYLLIWVMDVHLEILRGHIKAENSVNLKSRTENSSNSAVLPIESVMKVLYLLKTEHRANALDEVFSIWENDCGVHSIELDDRSFMEMVDRLIKSTESLPVSLRKVDDFSVSYIPIN